MRRWSVLAALPAVAAMVVLPLRVSADTVPVAPTALSMTRGGLPATIPPGSWVNKTGVDLHFRVEVAAGPLTPQVEMVQSGTAFSGQPNFSSQPLSASGDATVHVTGLVNADTYHWQARVSDASGKSSAWQPFSTDPNSNDLGIDESPPARPVISSPTNRFQNRWYNTLVPVLHWTSKDTISGIAGYTWQLERRAHVIPKGNPVASTGAKISNLGDGIWFFALRSVDQAGNWSPTATFRLQLDRHPPAITWLGPKRFTFNPYRGPANLKFRVSKDASARLDLYRVGTYAPAATFNFPGLRASQTVTLTWRGRDRYGKPVRAGFYYFSVSLTDRADNVLHTNLGGIDVNPRKPLTVIGGITIYPDGGKVIVVALHSQTLYAYDGTHLALQSFVTTGNPALPTPTGHYSVLGRYHPFQFVSPWPPGSPFYYAPSWVQYALPFRSDGYFLHDAPWRSNFGPGSNSQYGTPGQNYTGTHGCVNIPPGPMQFLWDWTPIGTPVDVVP